METYKIRPEEDFIKLGQLLKACNMVSSGVEAKIEIQNGNVNLNGAVEIQRGKKLHDGDIVSFNGREIKVIRW